MSGSTFTWQEAMAPVAAPAVAPSAANPTGWAPPPGAVINRVPVINVGHAPGSEAAPAQYANVPAPLPGPTDSAPPGATPVAGAPAGGAATFGWDEAQFPAKSAVPAKLSGTVANMGAGSSNAIAGMLGAPVDLATGALNAGARGINDVLGTQLGQIQNPVGGSNWIRSAEGLVGADPRNVEAHGEADQIARAAGAGMASMLLPWGAASALPELAGIPGAMQEAVSAGGAPTQALGGMAAAAAGQYAANRAPGPWKPLANFAGQMAAGAPVMASVAATKALLDGGVDLAGHFLAPMMRGGQAILAGQRIAGAAEDLGAVRDALAAAPAADAQAAQLRTVLTDPTATAEAQAVAREQLAALPRGTLVPGSAPTTFQLTGDQGLGRLERGVGGGSGGNNPAFIARFNEQNAARDAAVQNLAPVAASPDTVGTFFRQQLAAMDAQHAGADQAGVLGVRSAVDAVGGEPPVGPGAAATALQQYGEGLRSGLASSAGASKAAERALWARVDPDGSLRVNMLPIREAATGIVKAMPANSAPMEGVEARIFGTARLLPAVQPFAELGALRSRITDAMRAERMANGSSQALRRLTQLLGAVDDTMSEGVRAQAERDAAGVAAGTTAPGDTILGRFQTDKAADDGSGAASLGTATQGAGPGVPGNAAPGGAVAIPGAGGTAVPGEGRYGNAGSDSGLAPRTATQVTKPQSLLDFLIAKGGVRDQDGDLAAMDAQRVHHQQGGRLVNPKGQPLDYAREAAVEAGFPLPENSVNGLKDAIHFELAGRPVYRPEDEPIAAQWHQQAREAERSAQAAGDARFDAVSAAEDLGITLRPREIEHAAQMIQGGFDPADAAREAARAGEEVALHHNATLNAFGASGMPLAEQMALHGTEAPTEAPNFDADAAARYQAARAATATHHQTYTDPRTAPGVAQVLAPGSRAGEYREPASAVPGLLFGGGKGAAERVAAYLKAGGNAADIKDYLAFSLRSAAEKDDGTLKAPVVDRWLRKNREVLDAAGLGGQFDSLHSAQTALDESVARRVAEREAFEKSAAAHFLGDADPVARVGRILRSDTGVATMRELAQRTANAPAARAGLQRAVVEFITRDLHGNVAAGNTGSTLMKADAFQTFVRKSMPALRQIFDEDQVNAIRDVAADLQRSQRSIAGTKIAGGSNTAHDLAAIGEHLGGHPSGINVLIWSELAGDAGEHVGGMLGKAVSMFGIPVLKKMQDNGFKKVDQLVEEAMLHPELARSLLARVRPRADAMAWGKLVSRQIAHLAMTAAATSGRQAPSIVTPPGSYSGLSTPWGAPPVSAMDRGARP